MSKLKTSQFATALLVALLVLSSVASMASAAVPSAALADVRSDSVAGTITGGQFAKIWLGLEPVTQGENVTVTSEWNTDNPEDHGLGFFILDEGGMQKVLSGGASVRDANLSAGSKASPQAPAN